MLHLSPHACRLFYLPLVLMLALLLAGCGPEVTDPEQPLEINVGERFDIVVESNPTTGYEWRLLEPADEVVVRLVEQDYQGDTPMAVGSGGNDVWTFEATGSGTTTIVLGHFPPDSSVEEPWQTRSYQITVRQ